MQEMYRLLKNQFLIFGSLYEKYVKKLCYPHGLFWCAANRKMDAIVYSFTIRLPQDGIKKSLIQMLGGNKCKIDTGTFQNDMTNIKSRDDVFTLLVHLGYLAYDGQEKAVYIPNKEIRLEFLRAIRKGKHQEIAKLIAASNGLLQDTLRMDGQKVADKIAY